jgi:predicted Holliday junction resolvase-like endonuclease
MTPEEFKVKQEYEQLDYKVLHVGCPDLLCFKYDKETDKINDVIFVEVKRGKDRLSYEQAIWKKVLEQIKDAKYVLRYFK